MSVTSEFMVIVPRKEKHVMETVNKELYWADKDRHQQFHHSDMKWAGGNKYFLTDVWAACFNYLIPSAVEIALAGAEWSHPDEVFVFWEPGDYYLEYDRAPSGMLNERIIPPSVRTITQIRESRASS